MSHKENQSDIITSNNQVIAENLSKINEKINKIKSSLVDEEESEYENFYNRINFYFSNIVTELKLSFLEKIKEYQNREMEMKNKIVYLEEKLRQTENEKASVREEVSKGKKTNSELVEKIKKLEEDIVRKNDYVERNVQTIQNLTRKNKVTEGDVVHLLMDNMILKIELENSYLNLDSKSVDETQYVDFKEINSILPNSLHCEVFQNKKKDNSKTNSNINIGSKLSIIKEVNSNQKNEKSRNKNFNLKNESIGEGGSVYPKSKSKDHYTVVNTKSPVKEKYISGMINAAANGANAINATYYTNENSKLSIQNNYYQTTSGNNNYNYNNYTQSSTVQTPMNRINHLKTDYEKDKVTKEKCDKAKDKDKDMNYFNYKSQSHIKIHDDGEKIPNNNNPNSSTNNQSHQKSQSLIMNYRKNANSIKDLKISTGTENISRNSNNRVNLSANHKSYTNIPVMSMKTSTGNNDRKSSNNYNISNNTALNRQIEKEMYSSNTNMSNTKSNLLNSNTGGILSNSGLNANHKNAYSSNNYLTTSTSQGVKSIQNISHISYSKSIKESYKLDKNLINSSAEFERYKSSLLEKLSIKRSAAAASGASNNSNINNPTMINERLYKK